MTALRPWRPLQSNAVALESGHNPGYFVDGRGWKAARPLQRAHRRNRTFGAWAGFDRNSRIGPDRPLTVLSKKSEIPCRSGKASFVLGVWIGNSCGARIMSQRAGIAEAEIKALIEAWADAVRRHDQPENRLTTGLCKVDGAWCIKHEHHSVPAMD